jgi:hypothetical protein
VSLFFLAHVLLLNALPLMSCLSFLLKLGRTPRDKVSHISTLEALDVSMYFLLDLILAHHLGILDFALDALLYHPFLFSSSSSSSHHHLRD